MMKVFLFTIVLVICSTAANEVHLQKFKNGLSNFSAEFYHQSQPGNLIVSPFSAAVALSLLSQATFGQAFDELKKVLNLYGDKSTIADQFHEYFGLVQKSAGSEIMFANRIYVEQDYELKTDFQEVTEKVFFSKAESVDFTQAIETSKIINSFVEERTNQKVKNIVKPRMFSADMRVVLVNAIYLKGLWTKGFPKIWNKKRDFYISETEKVQIDSMHTVTNFHNVFVQDLNAQALRMDYANTNLSFIAILPKNRTGLSTLEKQIKNFSLSKIIADMRNTKQYVTLPQFTIETEIHLNDILKKADLSGLSDTAEPFYVSDIIHKTVIEIDDERIEDAAATGKREPAKGTGPNLHFLCDHPFMYHIWDRETNTTIFTGRFTN